MSLISNSNKPFPAEFTKTATNLSILSYSHWHHLTVLHTHTHARILAALTTYAGTPTTRPFSHHYSKLGLFPKVNSGNCCGWMPFLSPYRQHQSTEAWIQQHYCTVVTDYYFQFLFNRPIFPKLLPVRAGPLKNNFSASKHWTINRGGVSRTYFSSRFS